MDIEKRHMGILLMGSMEGGNPVEMVRNSSLKEIPLLQKMIVDQDNPYHEENVLNHCLSVLDLVKEYTDHPTVRLAALFHDSGKPDTKVMDNGKARFHGHDAVGAKLARAQLEDLYLPSDVIDDVALLIHNHMRPLGYINQPFGAKGVRRLIRKSEGHHVNIDDLMDLNRADILAHKNGGGKNFEGHVRLREHIERVR